MRALPILRAALLLLAWGALRTCSAGQCAQSLGYYAAGGYYVADVRIQSLLGLVRKVQASALPLQLRLQPRQRDSGGAVTVQGQFDTVALSLDTQTIRDRFLPAAGLFRFQYVQVMPAIVNCDDQERSLEIVYHVFSFNMPRHAGGTFQPDAAEVARSLFPGSFGQVLDTLFPRLVAGYDRTHRFYGGTSSVIAADAKVFDNLQVDAFGSSSSSMVNASFDGARDYAGAAIHHVEWGAGYSRTDEPSDALVLRKGRFAGRFGAATRAFGASGLVLHFGGALEGGNEQTNLDGGSAIPGPANCPYGALKGYVGASTRLGRNSVNFSYGLQLGKSTPGAAIDYTKHILGAVHAVQLFPHADHHRSLSLETGFMAGLSTGTLPVVERFFGGNAQHAFIAGDSWMINDAPFIRSFAANRLNRAGGVLGGENFVAFNATLAYPLFHRPLVPEEVLRDKDFGRIVQFALTSQTALLENRHMEDVPGFVALRDSILLQAESLTGLRRRLDAIRANSALPADVQELAGNVLADVDSADAEIAKMRQKGAPDPTAPVVTLAVGFAELATDALLVTIADDLLALEEALPPAMAAEKADLHARQDALRQAQAGFAAVHAGLDRGIAKDKAKADMKLPGAVLNQFLNELNLVSVSPAVLLDAARLGPQEGAFQAGFRYGLGPAVRFSLVNVNLTVGYSFNLRRKPWEGRGALSVSLSMGDFFR